jgi:flagellin
MSVINTNVKALGAQQAIKENNRALTTAMERLSSGKRINTAKDDAAGLAISTRMEAQTRGLNMAIRNANDGISLLQTGEGAMGEVINILQRMRELSVQAVNGTLNASDRTALNDEVSQLKTEIDRIATTTEFNNQKILDGSYTNKKLQIGDKAYQSMDINIGSVATKDLGMSGASFSNNTLVSTRLGTLADFSEGDIQLNGQDLAAFDADNADTGGLQGLIDNINSNVDNVVASAFNTVVAKNIGTGITTEGQLTIKVGVLGGTGTATSYSISKSDNMQELVDNINSQAGAQVTASINDDGKLVIDSATGATLSISDKSATSGYETASGFEGQTTTTAFANFNGFLKLDSKDGSPVRIERGNLSATSPGALADLEVLGFREITSEASSSLDAYTVTGKALTAPTGAWGATDIKINGVAIYDENIATTTFSGKLEAINNFSAETGVVAYAHFDRTISLSAGNFGELTADANALTVGQVISFNGTAVYTAVAGQGMDDLVTSINAQTSQTGITAKADGFNLRLTGSNVQSLKIDVALSSLGTADATGFNALDDDVSYGAIRLDSVGNKPISIELGSSNTVAEHGFLEANVGASDFDVNASTLSVAGGNSLLGLNVSTAESATAALSTIDNAIDSVSAQRSVLGASQNRLNYTINNLSNVVMNTSASKSQIMDTDYAKETTELARSQIIQQAATAMLAQANQQPQSVLSLLQ